MRIDNFLLTLRDYFLKIIRNHKVTVENNNNIILEINRPRPYSSPKSLLGGLEDGAYSKTNQISASFSKSF